MQFTMRCRDGERHPLPGMADGTTEFLDGVMLIRYLAMRMRGVWLPSALEAGAIDAHVAGLAAVHAHERLVKVGIFSPVRTTCWISGGLATRIPGSTGRMMTSMRSRMR